MARSSSIGGIFAELTLRDQKFATGMKGAGQKLKAFGAASMKYGAMAGAAITAGLAVGVKATLEHAGALDDASVNTGIAIDDMMLLRKSYELGGVAINGVAKDIGKMQKALVTASQGGLDPFESIGLSVSELMAEDPAKQFSRIGAAIMRISNPAERTAKAMEIFGRSGGSLINVFGQVEGATRFLGDMPGVMKEFAAEMAHADDLVNELPAKSTQFFTGFTAGIITQVIPALETMNDFEFTKLGKSLGDSLAKAVMTGGKHLAILINSFTQMQSGETPIDAGKRFKAEQDELDRQDKKAAEERKRQREADAAYEKARMFEYANAPDYVDPASLISAKAATALKPRSFSMPEFSDYQRRGLSLSESPSANLEKKTLDVMMQVRDILSRIERSPQAATF
jgi:hypothetical protein